MQIRRTCNYDEPGNPAMMSTTTQTLSDPDELEKGPRGSYSYAEEGEQRKQTASMPLDYDAQYTSSNTGLIYLRARVYDPATAQFLSRDPLTSLTREPYAYAGDNPVNLGDPHGLEALPIPIEGPAGLSACADPLTAAMRGCRWLHHQERGRNAH
jgi:RHS repeat-associated protein